MTVVAARLYRGGVFVADIEIDHKNKPALAADEFVWIGLVEPNGAELALVGDCFGLHPLAIEDVQHDELQLPKIEQYGDQLFLVLRTAHLEDEHIAYGETSVFLGKGFIVTVRHGSARAHSQLRAQLERTPTALAHGPDYVLHSIVDFIVDGYFPIVETLEERALTMEGEAADNFLDRPTTLRIFAMRRESVRFHRALGVMDDVVARLVNVQMPHVDEDMRPYFRDILDHVRRVEFRLTGLREILTSVVETSSLLEQQRQGTITRQLAAWAAILAVPTAIAGIYGMNFTHMPELQWEYGYPVTLVLIVAACLLLYRRFRRSGWL